MPRRSQLRLTLTPLTPHAATSPAVSRTPAKSPIDPGMDNAAPAAVGPRLLETAREASLDPRRPNYRALFCLLNVVGRRGLEPRTYGLKVHSSAIELAARGCQGTRFGSSRREPSRPDACFRRSVALPVHAYAHRTVSLRALPQHPDVAIASLAQRSSNHGATR
jgi:hypothetical protein